MEHLRYILEIEKHHSIAAAAQALYLGQTTLSAVVKSVEEELGFPIFERVHKGVRLMPEGEEALALIREINDLFQQILALDSPNAAAAYPVNVVLSPSINSALAVPLTQSFLQKEPNANLQFHVVIGDEVGTMLLKNDGNIGLTYFSDANCESYRMIAGRYQIETHSLFRDYLYLVVSKDHPLAGRDKICSKELENLELAMLPHHSFQNPASVRDYGGGNRFTIFNSISLIKQAVLTQNMATILSGFPIQYHESGLAGRFKAVLLTDPERKPGMNLCLIHRAESNLKPMEKELLGCIKDYFAQLPSPPFSPEARQISLDN